MRVIGGKDYWDGAAWGMRDDSVVFLRKGDRALSRGDAVGLGLLAAPLVAGAELVSGGAIPYGLHGETGYLHQHEKNGEASEHRRRGIAVQHDGLHHEVWPLRVTVASRQWQGVIAWTSARRSVLGHEQRIFWSEGEIQSWAAGHGFRFVASRRFGMSARKGAPPFRDFFGEIPPNQPTADALAQAGIVTAVDAPRGSSVFRDTPVRIDADELKEFGFYRVLSAPEAYQEIAMWVGGVLPRPGALTVEITDDRVKAAKHGMDKWSFRTPPTAKGRG